MYFDQLTDDDVVKFWEGVDVGDDLDCWCWQRGCFSTGYGVIWAAGKQMKAHRLSCFLEHGSPPVDKPHALHACDNPPCCNPSHLRWGSHVENMAEMADRDRSAKGELHGYSKLTAEQVLAIRADPRPQRKIAADYGVHQTLISLIKTRKNWSHL